MCGIAGKLRFDRGGSNDRETVLAMITALRHRGPDDGGVWTEDGVALGSRRLAVIDLTPDGHQPMTNEDGSLVIVFNGEIYNFGELRQRLERSGHVFRSHTDTEAILHLYEDEGARCVERLRGMFAFALWDRSRRQLLLARDRFGKKPLYYALRRNRLTFASEPHALFHDPELRPEPDPAAIDQFLALGYVPGEACAFRGVRKLPPAHYMVVCDGRVSMERYWQLCYEPKRTDPEPALAAELREHLEEAVRIRMVSDVPIGVLLSGGIDSSAVVAMMRRITSGPIKTFSIGFGEAAYNELPYARMIARRFETDHQELVVEPDPERQLQDVARHYSEPFADSSAIPSLAVCRLARRDVTVVLGGDGGDEMFMGYDRYRASAIAARLDALPAFVRRSVSGAAKMLPSASPKSTVARVRRFAEGMSAAPGRRYAQWVACFDASSRRELYAPGFAEARRGEDPLSIVERASAHAGSMDPVEALAYADIQLYLPDDLLVKMDIASMAHSLEARAPLLDHRLAEFAASLPIDLKLRGGTQKYLLKESLRGLVPSEILERPKMGFGVPIEHWLRSELRELAYDILLDSRTVQRGYFNPAATRRLLDEHVAGRVSHHFKLWALLTLELWHRTFVDLHVTAEVPA